MVSIRLASGGHSFSATTLQKDICNADCVRVIIDTHRTTLIPAEQFDKERAADYLAINGLMPTADEEVVCNSIASDIVAVMAINRTAKTAIESHVKGSIEWYTPLLDTSHNNEECCCVEIASATCYIRIYNTSGLWLAEALNISSDEELLYYVTQICEIGDIATSIPIYIKGERSCVKVLKRYFKKVICE